MKKQLRTLFSPVLKIFEAGTEPFSYKPSQRTILIVIGCIFTALAALVFVIALGKDIAYLLPVFIFAGIGFISLLVGVLGSDRAVARIWNSR